MLHAMTDSYLSSGLLSLFLFQKYTQWTRVAPSHFYHPTLIMKRLAYIWSISTVWPPTLDWMRVVTCKFGLSAISFGSWQKPRRKCWAKWWMWYLTPCYRTISWLEPTRSKWEMTTVFGSRSCIVSFVARTIIVYVERSSSMLIRRGCTYYWLGRLRQIRAWVGCWVVEGMGIPRIAAKSGVSSW